MKLTLVRVVRKDTDKAGKPLVTADGRKYVRLGIQCKEYGSKWLSGFSSPWNEGWREGDEVDAEVEQKGEYLNISKPDPIAALSKSIFNLGAELAKYKIATDARIAKLEAGTKKILNYPQFGSTPIIEDDEQPLGDLPF